MNNDIRSERRELRSLQAEGYALMGAAANKGAVSADELLELVTKFVFAVGALERACSGEFPTNDPRHRVFYYRGKGGE